MGALLLLLLLGVVLPYVTLTYIDASSVPVTGRPRLFGAAGLLGGVDPTYLPGYRQEIRSAYNLALNFAAAGPGLQQIGTVVALLSCWALLTEEINRIAWWFLHLSAYPLLLAAGPAPRRRRTSCTPSTSPSASARPGSPACSPASWSGCRPGGPARASTPTAASEPRRRAGRGPGSPAGHLPACKLDPLGVPQAVRYRRASGRPDQRG